MVNQTLSHLFTLCKVTETIALRSLQGGQTLSTLTNLYCLVVSGVHYTLEHTV